MGIGRQPQRIDYMVDMIHDWSYAQQISWMQQTGPTAYGADTNVKDTKQKLCLHCLKVKSESINAHFLVAQACGKEPPIYRLILVLNAWECRSVYLSVCVYVYLLVTFLTEKDKK